MVILVVFKSFLSGYKFEKARPHLRQKTPYNTTNNRLGKVAGNIYHLFCDRSYYYSYCTEINNFI